MANVLTVTATNNAEIDGLLGGTKWTGTITYSFPTSPNSYVAGYGLGEPDDPGFAPVSAALGFAVQYAISLISSYTNANIVYAGSGSSDIMVAQSPVANPTSWAYLPDPTYSEGGDAWFGTAYDFSLASLGNYYFMDALHEIGHSFGLKHSNTLDGVANVAVPTAHDDSEYTVMSYRSYVGAADTGFLTNEDYGYAQTYMANDILALQTLYGANYTTHSENTVYSWSPTTGQQFINGVAQLAPGGGVGGSANRIFETIWDGNGIDTYDLSNYTTGVTINLNPGASSITSTDQLAYLGDGHYASGNIYNAYLFNNDPRSYIDNAIGGSGNDILIGNAIANVLNGGAGNDTLDGGAGNDTLIGGPGVDIMTGGSGADTFVFALGDSSPAAGQHDLITDFTSGEDHIDLSAIDAISGTAAHDLFRFIGTSAFSGSAGELNYFYDSARGVTVVQADTNGDGIADLAIDLSGNIPIKISDFVGVAILPTVIESFGATSLAQLGSNYYLYANGTSSGPTLKYNSAAFTAGQFGCVVIGAEATGSGYQVVLKIAGADTYAVWNTDSNGNYVSNAISGVSGKSIALESFETTFHQDLNGDGTIGVVGTTIESSGSTSLVQVGNSYGLFTGGSGPSLKYGGTEFTAGQFGCVVVGAEAVGSGYQVVLKIAGADTYAVWNTDSNGNYVSNAVSGVSGKSIALESFETSFHQDLNGDGTIGIPTTTIESFGSTSLAQVGNNYYLYTAGAGPALKYNGAAFTAGQFGCVVVGAEAVGSGYQVVLKVAGADTYAVWNTDSNGNYVSNAISGVSGKSIALESFETSFHQDLNGDGTIGVVGTTIESSGSTSLVQVGNSYGLFTGGSGPSLKYGGTEFTAGQFGCVVVGAEAVGSGYQVVLKVAGADTYAVWNTDSNGNYVSNAISGVSGKSIALESFETSFHQDLNGDGTIGVVGTTIESSGSTSLVQVGNSYGLFTGGSGPSLKYGGTEFTAGQFGCVVVGAEAVGSGYQVVLKVAGADTYAVWNTDSNGNYVSNAISGVSGKSIALESFETSFHQDLNGDGTIGVVGTTIESSGWTSLVQVGNSYGLFTGGSGPSLKYGGTEFTAGQFGCVVIGAEATGSGYQVVLKVAGADTYAVWNTDSNGNYVSNAISGVSGKSIALESFETSFHQDLNGDGTIGVVAHQNDFHLL